MTLLACGSRTWGIVPKDTPPAERPDAAARARGERARTRLEIERLAPDALIHGAAEGADSVAANETAEWACAAGRACVVTPFPADWDRDGPKAAGPIRNQRMLDEGRTDRGVAFGKLWKPDPRRTSGKNPGWKLTGTGDMVRRMLAAKLPVRWIKTLDAPRVDLTKMPGPTA